MLHTRRGEISRKQAVACLLGVFLVYALVALKSLQLSSEVQDKNRGSSPGAAVQEAVGADDAREKIVAKAHSLLGTPYLSGGESDAGLDCSGLVVVAYAAAGIRASHKAELLAQMGEQVDFSRLELADLVFFRSNASTLGHVGVYVGDGSVIHASSGRGKVVLESLYEVSRVAGLTAARRIINIEK